MDSHAHRKRVAYRLAVAAAAGPDAACRRLVLDLAQVPVGSEEEERPNGHTWRCASRPGKASVELAVGTAGVRDFSVHEQGRDFDSGSRGSAHRQWRSAGCHRRQAAGAIKLLK